jgi:hypothetical protein
MGLGTRRGRGLVFDCKKQMSYVSTKRGFGDAQSIASGFQFGAGIAAPVAAPVIGTALSTTGSLAAGATILGMAPALAVPLIGAALVGVTFAITKLIQNSGCGPTCVITSQWANQAEPLLRQNLNAYFALPKPRSRTAQQAALVNFDAVWNQLVQYCSQANVGNAGKRCISDRQAGACTWKQAADYGADIQAAGEPAMGQCWNWFSGYRDPIANDPNVVPDAQAALSSSVGSLFSGGGSLSPLLLLAGALALGVWLR